MRQNIREKRQRWNKDELHRKGLELKMQSRQIKYGSSYINDERAQLILLQRDDFVIAGLLCQLQQGARRRQPQPRHVRFAREKQEETDLFIYLQTFLPSKPPKVQSTH